MFELAFGLMFGLALVFAGFAGLWDLATTDIPDEIPAIMTAFGLFGWYIYGMTFGNFLPLAIAVCTGTILLAFGWILYRKGYWGGGDAKLLGAVFYMLPSLSFLMTFALNFFLVALIYTVIYVLIVGTLHRHTFGLWLSKMKRNTVYKISAGILCIFCVAMFILALFNPMMLTVFFLSIAFLGLFLFWTYARILESRIFRRTIPVSKLKPGDILADSKRWDGITEEELAKIKRTTRVVTIKEGIRFGPVFPLTLGVSWMIGNLFLL